MRLLKKLLTGVAALLAIAVIGLAIAIRYEASCEAIDGGDPADSMWAVHYSCYGGPEALQLGQHPKPVPQGNELLIRVESAAVNPLDWHFMRGSPYFMRLTSGIGKPSETRLGRDFSGVVEAVGPDVTRFGVGDAVFGGAGGAFAEYLLRTEDFAVAAKPDNVSHAEAAAAPVAALTALQALRDKGGLQSGERVLINGASGGVGTYAVQIAKAMGAHVTGVSSARNAERVLGLGADAVIDYKTSDYTRLDEEYDLIVDNVGNHSVLANRRALAPGGRMVMVAGGHGDWLGPVANPLQALVISPFIDEQMTMLLAQLKAEDLATIADMMAAGELRSVIDRHYSLEQIAEAVEYSESGRARGKIIIDMNASP